MNWKLSIVVPCYNEEKRIRPLLESLKAQTVKPEVLFVDGGSTDGTTKLIEELIKTNRNIRLLRETEHRSPANARNIGIKAATGNLLRIMNADAVFEKDYTKKVIEAFRQNPDADDIDFKHEPLISKTTNAFQKALFLKDEVYGYALNGQLHSITKTELQRKIGYYDPKLGFGEDRCVERHGFQKHKFKRVVAKEKIGMSQLSYTTFYAFFVRCLWYGRTIPIYLKKERTDWPILLYYLISVLTIPLIFLFLVHPIFSVTLTLILAAVFSYGLWRVLKIVCIGYCCKELVMIPFLEVAELIGIGLGFFQYILGNRTVGR